MTRLLERVHWFPATRQLVFVPRNGIELPGRLRGLPVSREWTVEEFGLFLAGLYGRRWVAPLATVDSGDLGAEDTPERALLDYLDGGLPPLWRSGRTGVRNVLLGGTVTGPGGAVVCVVDTDGSVHFQTIERFVEAVQGILLVVGDQTGE
ncbi:MAG TPA: hypothetical protein VJT49_21220 [Amycolatopsis sp.]|uniref:DUF6885 family protein n=1 Tax=Amycolatopsis sp. TaxID=37632 RepID=UPI002B4AA9FD|nr:hypothetical protein [Amycolatopsis sp.]HKS47583.1 hypothetical protein [Amycolatopsis sp.]